MNLPLTLNRSSELAMYRQIAEQIKTQIHTGDLPSGSRLPTVRKLAKSLDVAVLTVHNAYAELQSDGLIESVVGKGTYVSDGFGKTELPPQLESNRPFDPYNVLGDIYHLMHVKQMRSMAVAEPDERLFPADEFWSYLSQLKPHATELFRYGTMQGNPDLRVVLTERLAEQDIHTSPAHILITNGVMQGLNIVTRALTNRGDTVLVEEPTFLGILNLLRLQGLRPLPIPMLPDGPDMVAMKALIEREKPRFYYAVPNFQNPTGGCISLEKREQVLELASRYNITIFEDDIYGKLAYDAPAPPSFFSLNNGRTEVIYLNSYTKCFLPGVRIGYLVASDRFINQLVTMRHISDLSGSPLLEQALANFLKTDGFKRHLKNTVPQYRKRRDVMMRSLTMSMPKFVSWTTPQGGFSCWVTMPHLFEPGELFQLALAEGIGIASGEAFLSRPSLEQHFRLCFGTLSAEAVDSSVRQLGELIARKG